MTACLSDPDPSVASAYWRRTWLTTPFDGAAPRMALAAGAATVPWTLPRPDLVLSARVLLRWRL